MIGTSRYRNPHLNLHNISNGSQIFFDALDPSRSFSARQAKRMVPQLAAGLKTIGFQSGDCLDLHSPNDVGMTLRVYEPG